MDLNRAISIVRLVHHFFQIINTTVSTSISSKESKTPRDMGTICGM